MKVLETAVTSPEIKKLEAQIKKAADVYYNSGKSIMSDKEFDALVEKLKTLAPKSRVLNEIGAPVKKQKVKLPYFMGSLDKLNSQSTESWLSDRESYMLSDKMDGVSILIIYKPNEIKAYTRGNGTHGQDISFLVPHLKIPKLKTNLALRGEIIMKTESFDKWKSSFENPRNLVSGIVNRKSIHRAVKDLDVIIYEQLSPRSVQSTALKKLKSVGFSVVPHKVFKSLDAETLVTTLRERKQKSKYDIDGLVVTIDKNNPVNSSGNPKWSKAFKENDLSLAQTAEVVKVHWDVSRRGLIKPKLEIKPLRISGVTIKFVTAFNAKYVVDNKLGKGSQIKIVRSGDVIPHIVEVIKKTKPEMPTTEYLWNNSGVDIVAVDPKSYDNYTVKTITHFLKTIGVENVSSGLVHRFILYGLDSISKITRAPKNKFLSLPGVKETLASKIHNNIQNNIRDINLPTLMDASGVFDNMGTRKLSKVTTRYPNILSDYNKLPKTSLIAKIEEVGSFSTLSAKAFVKALPKFISFINKNPHITYKASKKVEKKSGSLSGQTFIFTGFRDRHLEATLESKGGKLGLGVTKTTSMVVTKDKDSSSTKITKAKDLQIKIMTLDQFKKWLDSQ